jgi:hypothetical protein
MKKRKPRAIDPMKRLLARSTRCGANGCWLWTGAKDYDGYGQISVSGKSARAHRVSYEDKHGTIPLGAVLCHHCDNPSCINPDHMFLGTNADNVADKISKGRQARGEVQGSAKLTADKVLAIRAAKTMTQRALAKQYGVSQGQIYNVRSGKHWGHVSCPQSSTKSATINPKRTSSACSAELEKEAAAILAETVPYGGQGIDGMKLDQES